MSCYDPGWDAHLHADVIYRLAAGGAEQVIASSDAMLRPPDAGAVTGLHAVVSGPAVDARCGDHLVLRIEYLTGSKDILEIDGQMQIP